MKKTFLSLLRKNTNSNTTASTTNLGVKAKAISNPSPMNAGHKQDGIATTDNYRLCYFQTDTARVYMEYPPTVLSPVDSRSDVGSGSETGYLSAGGAEVAHDLSVTDDGIVPLPPPPPSYTRFVCISDTHSHSFPVPDGDVLLHSGDLTNIGSLADFEKTVDWLCSLPHQWKIITAGNHDLALDEQWYDLNWTRWHTRIGRQKRSQIMNLLTSSRAKAAGLVYLQDQTFKFKIRENGKQWSVYGSPWSPEFCNWAFGYDRGEDAKKLVSKIPNTDILLTHSPPHMILDETNRDENVGCEALVERLKSGDLRPRLHVFGHIHEARGAEIWYWGKGGDDDEEQDECGAKVIREGDFREVEEEKAATHDEKQGEAVVDEAKQADKGHSDDGPSLQPASSSPASEQPKQRTGIFTASLQSPSPHSCNDETQVEKEEDNYTIFVNAANWPMGPRSLRAKRHRGGGADSFGGLGFQPVVVDLLDTP